MFFLDRIRDEIVAAFVVETVPALSQKPVNGWGGLIQRDEQIGIVHRPKGGVGVVEVGERDAFEDGDFASFGLPLFDDLSGAMERQFIFIPCFAGDAVVALRVRPLRALLAEHVMEHGQDPVGAGIDVIEVELGLPLLPIFKDLISRTDNRFQQQFLNRSREVTADDRGISGGSHDVWFLRRRSSIVLMDARYSERWRSFWRVPSF